MRKNKKKKKINIRSVRHVIFIFIIVICFIVLAFRLMELQINMGDYYLKESSVRKTRSLTVNGTRGKIYDRFGVELARDEVSFSVEIFKNELIDQRTNDVILKTIKILEQNQDTYIDNFPIKIVPVQTGGSNGLVSLENKFVFDWGTEDKKIAQNKEKSWKETFKIPQDEDAEQAFDRLRQRYDIDDDVSDIDARKIMAIRQEIDQSGYRAYIPIKIATNISENSVAQLEERRVELPGVNIKEESTRVYPLGSLAAHTIGYLGKISDSEKEYYTQLGYDIAEDLVGKAGIEKEFEEYLTGSSGDRKGSKRVEVDVYGKINRELEYIEPIPGNNIVLTLDARLQKVAEEKLIETIQDIRAGKFGKPGLARESAGAAVAVLDAKTGEVLALASYPTYDPNDIVQGRLTPEELANLPQYHYAIQGTYAPGSVFKMLTGIAGLEEGKLSPNIKITTKGVYKKYDSRRGISCLAWSNYRTTHGSINVADALRVSCNYFFLEVMDRLGLDKLTRWADLLGLNSKTGIEIPGERAGHVHGEHTNEIREKILPHYHAVNDQEGQGEETLSRVVEAIARLNIYDTRYELGQTLFESQRENYKDKITDYLTNDLNIKLDELQFNKLVEDLLEIIEKNPWNGNDMVSAGIGQATTNLTPLGIARYVAAIVNGGYVYDTTIIKEVIDYKGAVVKEQQPKLVNKVNFDAANIAAIKEGMGRVTEEGGTAAVYFRDFPIRVGGKTGTSQKSGGGPETNNGIFVAFAPYDDPELVVSVVIGEGRIGGYGAPIARAIFEEYFQLNKGYQQEIQQDALVP